LCNIGLSSPELFGLSCSCVFLNYFLAGPKAHETLPPVGFPAYPPWERLARKPHRDGQPGQTFVANAHASLLRSQTVTGVSPPAPAPVFLPFRGFFSLSVTTRGRYENFLSQPGVDFPPATLSPLFPPAFSFRPTFGQPLILPLVSPFSLPCFPRFPPAASVPAGRSSIFSGLKSLEQLRPPHLFLRSPPTCALAPNPMSPRPLFSVLPIPPHLKAREVRQSPLWKWVNFLRAQVPCRPGPLFLAPHRCRSRLSAGNLSDRKGLIGFFPLVLRCPGLVLQCWAFLSIGLSIGRNQKGLNLRSIFSGFLTG